MASLRDFAGCCGIPVAYFVAALGSHGCSPPAEELKSEARDQVPHVATVALDAADTRPNAPRAARYPLNLAALTWTQLQKLERADGGQHDNFGSSLFGSNLDINNGTALVGAAGDGDHGGNSGSAYVFGESGGNWSQQQKLAADDAASNDRFGSSASLYGDTAIVGARGEGDADTGGPTPGAVYIFARNALAWAQQQKLRANDGSTEDDFGTSVSLYGDTAIVGAYRDDDHGSNSGSAYIFVRTATSWTQQQKLSANDAAAEDYFGASVSLDGDTAIVGAFGSNVDASSDAGSAYVFVRSATSWAQQQKLTALNASAQDYFGLSVSLDANTAVVGVRGDDGAASNSGAAYVYVRNATTWDDQQKLSAGDAEAGDLFGHSVSLQSDTILVGAWADDDGGAEAGSAYIFTRSATSWLERQKLFADNAAAQDNFGSNVALDTDTALVGAKGDAADGTLSGAAYVMAIRLVDGERCSEDTACASKSCTDGYCCDQACQSPCETCAATGQEGACALAPRYAAPSSSCSGHLCSGTAPACPSSCLSDDECSSEHYCRGSVVCLTRAADGKTCIRDANCLSGHCVDGVCCAQACDEGCGSCVSAGSEGVCSPLAAGHPGGPSCAPYLCTGANTACPMGCTDHRDCALEQHCVDGSCRPDAELGDACPHDDACASAHCTDDVCCVAASCQSYRCGPAGGCEATCSSSAQCAPGHSCNSAGSCEPQLGTPEAPSQSGGCHIGSSSAPGPSSLPWLAALTLLAWLDTSRRRTKLSAHRTLSARLTSIGGRCR